MGEIGGNDYNYAYFAGGSIKQLRASVPLVVEALAKATSVSYIALITSRLIKKNTYKKKKGKKHNRYIFFWLLLKVNFSLIFLYMWDIVLVFDRRRGCGIVGAGEFADWMLGSVSDPVRKS